jgi:hypothetical protein
LEAINTELPEKVIVGRERAGRDVEVLRGESQDLLRSLLECAHAK